MSSSNLDATEYLALLAREQRPTPLVIAGLPCPDRRLNPNRGTPLRTVKRLRAQQRRDAGLVTYAAIGPTRSRPVFPAGVRVRVDALLLWPGRFPDQDNAIAMLKGVWDGLTDGGAWADDNQAYWGTLTFQPATVLGGGAWLTLTLTAEEVTG